MEKVFCSECEYYDRSEFQLGHSCKKQKITYKVKDNPIREGYVVSYYGEKCEEINKGNDCKDFNKLEPFILTDNEDIDIIQDLKNIISKIILWFQKHK